MNTMHAVSALGIGCILVLACSNKKPDEPHTMPATTFTLNVLLSEGVEGYPSTGVYEYLPDDTVEYWYLLKPEFCNLLVTLDGQDIASEGTFIIDRDCDLRATSERKILWRFQTPNSIYYASPAVGNDGAIYFGSGLYTTDQGWSPGALFALNPDGTLRWSRDIGEAAYSPAIGNSGTNFIMDRTYTVRAFTAEGSLIWTFNDFVNPQFVKRDMGHRTPAIGSDGTVYIGADGLYALDPSSGTKLWHVPRRRTPSQEKYQLGKEEAGHQADDRRKKHSEYHLLQATQLNGIQSSSHRHSAYDSADQGVRGTAGNAQIPGQQVPQNGAQQGSHNHRNGNGPRLDDVVPNGLGHGNAKDKGTCEFG